MKKGFSVRLPDEIRAQLEFLAKQKSDVLGRGVTVSSIMISALEYGLPVVERENSHQIVMPLNLRTKTELVAHMASALVKVGLDSAFKDSGFVESLSLPGESV